MQLDPRTWERAQSLFHAALDLPEEERLPFLRGECAGNPHLLAAVQALLEGDRQSSGVLDRDLSRVAGDLLDDDPLPYEFVGPYRLSRVLGRGGMGVVYLGVREDTGGTAAIKILRDAGLSPARRERFAGEQRAMASLRHPSIAQLYDADVLPNGTPFFVMEYVDGLPLTDYCRFWDSPLRERLEIYRRVCEAVQAAHQQAIVHRDLKPSNILVKPDGTLKLLDFGIAKQLDEPGAVTDPTQTVLRFMTPAYAAPEQVLGRPTGIYTDIYALGVLLYELLTDRKPLDLSDKTPGEVERAIAEEEPRRPSQAGGGRGKDPLVVASRGEWSDLDVMCMTAMHKDSERRYRTVQGLIRDIDHFLRSEPLDAQADSLGYRLGKFLRRNLRSVAGALAVLLAGLALVAFYTTRLTNARDQAVAEAERTRRIQDFMLNLFQGGEESVGPADTLRVITLMERGVQEAGLLAGEPEVQAELYHTLGGLYQQLGSLNRADTLLGRALERRRAVFGGESPEAAGSLVALGGLRLRQARLQEAEALVREGVRMASTTLPPEHPLVLEAKTALGRVLQEKGDYPGAVAILEEVVAAYRDTGDRTPELAGAMGDLANTHFYAGNYEASDSLNRMSLAMDRELYGPGHPNVADGLINLGAVQFQWGRYAEAEDRYRQALEIMEAYHGEEHPETASALTLLGRALNYQGETREALGHLKRARQIQLRVFGPVHRDVASTENDIGLIALAEGDLALARDSFRRMTEIYDSIYAEPHWFQGIARSNLGAVHLEAGRYARAEERFREAVEVFLTTLSPGDMNTAIARIKLGRALLRQGRWGEAEEASRAGYDALVEITDPGVSWLQAARSDLAEAYEALERPEEARRYREEAERYR